MKLLIVGPGAAGAYLGARLIERGGDVTFLTSDTQQIALMTRGLHVRSPYGQFRRAVTALTPSELCSTYNIVVIATRAHRLETGLEAAEPAIGPKTVVVATGEGIGPFDLRSKPGGPRIFGAVLQARTFVDGDGIVVHRPPAAELHIGALNGSNPRLAGIIANAFRGRGLEATAVADIRARGWERFAFMAASVAASAIQGRPLRDTLRFPFGAANFDSLLKEAHQVGVAAGYHPDHTRLRSYRRSFMLEDRPVQPPAMIRDGGAAGDEAAFLLGEMMGIARQHGMSPLTFMQAWRAVYGDHARRNPRTNNTSAGESA